MNMPARFSPIMVGTTRSLSIKKGSDRTMKTFTCKRLRLCGYLIDRGFMPIKTVPDKHNPVYSVWLFEETPALTAAVIQYFSVDCWTAKSKETKGLDNNERIKEEQYKNI